MPHPNDMTHWDFIGCRFGHGEHATRTQRVRLGGPTGYKDHPPIPQRFRRSFPFEIYQWKHYHHLSAYCPGRDAVSETIESHGVWEPMETILTLSACTASSGLAVDFGAQLGWFSILAAQCGLGVLAIDADEENLRVLSRSAAANGVKIQTQHQRVDADSVWQSDQYLPEHLAFVKIDLEGAEIHALALLEQRLNEGAIDHLLVEISPVFADYYGDLVVNMIANGYLAWMLPEKSLPPPILDRLPHDLGPGLHGLEPDEVRNVVNGWHQKNVWFATPDARWA